MGFYDGSGSLYHFYPGFSLPSVQFFIGGYTIHQAGPGERDLRTIVTKLLGVARRIATPS
jgi:hypothetical protein